MDEEVKLGARNNSRDAERLQAIHDFAVENGAYCGGKSVETDDIVIFHGGEVKALDGGKVGGYLVRFTDANHLDLTGDYFAADTDFGDATASPVLYHHGMDKTIGLKSIGKGDLRRDDVGVWIEAQLELRDEYEKAIYELAKQEKLGWSSGSASHLVTREGSKITRWPLGLDASMTPTPAEPQNTVMQLKSLPPIDEGHEVSRAGDDVQPNNQTNPEIKGVMKMEITEDKLAELVTSAAKTAVEEYKKAEEPATVKTVPNVEVVKDEADQQFATAGDFFMAVKNAAIYPHKADVKLLSRKATGLGEDVPASGGYLLQDTVAAGMFERMYKTGEILSRVANYNIGPNSNGLIINAVDESSRATGSRYGGIRGYWLAEAGTKTASAPKFRQLNLKLKKVAALCYATDELLQDSVALESWLTRTVPEELKFLAEDAVYNGDGIGKPLGIMSSTALITVTRDTGGAIKVADIAAMWSRRWPGVNDYVWLITPDVWGQLLQLSITDGVFLPPGGFSANPYATLLGRPVIETEYSAALNTTGDILLASLSQYATITKGGIQAASSIHVNFLSDESVFRFVYRIDGAPLWQAALTPFKATNTLSPFVVLGSAT